MRLTVIAGAMLLAATVAHADRRKVAAESDEGARPQLVVVNAAQTLRDVGQLQRLHRALDDRDMLLRLPADLEATLDGRNMLSSNLEAIRAAYASADYDAALTLVIEDKRRLLELAAGDIALALTELCQWHGIVAAARNDNDEAMRQFRTAHRLNPAWQIDRNLASPRVRALATRARTESEQRGALRLDANIADATLAIDGGEPRATGTKIRLPVGLHLVVVKAPARTTYAELVEIAAGKVTRLDVALDPETRVARAARLVDASAAAPAGRLRLTRARPLAKMSGASQLLFIEDGGDDHVTVRLYDVDSRKVSKSLRITGRDSSAAIAREIEAALDPSSLADVDASITAARPSSSRWYQHWYVWAGIAIVAGGGYLGYQAVTREPTTLRGL